MKNHYEQFAKKNLKLNLINKFIYLNSKKLPNLTKINLSLVNKTSDLKILATNALGLEAITAQKNELILSKKGNAHLKIRKNQPLGAKVLLQKTNKNNFACKVVSDIFSNYNKSEDFYNIKCTVNTMSFINNNNLVFKEIENNFNIFQKLSSLKITYVTTTKTLKENMFVLRFYKIPLNFKILCKYNSAVECKLAKFEDKGSNLFIC